MCMVATLTDPHTTYVPHPAYRIPHTSATSCQSRRSHKTRAGVVCVCMFGEVMGGVCVRAMRHRRPCSQVQRVAVRVGVGVRARVGVRVRVRVMVGVRARVRGRVPVQILPAWPLRSGPTARPVRRRHLRHWLRGGPRAGGRRQSGSQVASLPTGSD